MNLDKLKLSEKRLKICQKLGFENSEDILNYFPYRYEEISIIPYKDFIEGGKIAFSGELLTYPSTFRYAGNRSITRFKVLYDDEELNVTIFNRPWLNGLRINAKVFIVGKYEGKNKAIQESEGQ